MKKWHVYRKFHILVEARNEEEAAEIAGEVDMMNWDFLRDEVGSIPED